MVTRPAAEGSQVVENGAIFQRDGEIVEVGSWSDISRRYGSTQVIGDGSDLVIPGLTNAHHHVGLTPFQLGVQDDALEPWIIRLWALRDVDWYLDTLYHALQMISSGITTVLHNHMLSWLPLDDDLFSSATRILDAYTDSGMRVAFSLAHRDQNRIVYDSDEAFLATLPNDLASLARRHANPRPISIAEYLELCGRLHSERHTDRQHVFVSPHNVQWCTDELLLATKQFADERRTGLHIHLQETIYQKLYGLREWGVTPLQHLNELGFLGANVSCAHGVWLTDCDVDVLAESGAVLCHNASSNLRLRSGIAPLNALLERGANVAIGIDEAGLNDDKDILQEMRLVHKLHRTPGIGSRSPSTHEVLTMCAVAGTRATLFADQTGALERGRRADIVLVDWDRIAEPYLDEATNPVDALLYRGKGLDVRTVLVDGEVLLRDHEFVKANKQAIAEELRASFARVLRDEERERVDLSRRLLPFVENYFREWKADFSDPHYIYNDRL